MNSLDQKIEVLKREVQSLEEALSEIDKTRSKAETDLAVANARLESFIEASTLLNDTLSIPKPQRGLADQSKKGDSATRTRALSGPWKNILGDIAENYPRAYGYDDLDDIALWHGHSVSRANLRSQMSLYKNRGLIDGDGNSGFFATEKGAAAAKVTLGIKGSIENHNENPRQVVDASDNRENSQNTDATDFDDEIPF